MGSPFGGDGGDTLVDPNDGCRIVQEYVFLAMELTENCGRSDGTVRSVRDIDPHDPFPRFIAPFEADTVNPDHWVAGGQFVWLNTQRLRDSDRAPSGHPSSTTAPGTRRPCSRARTTSSGPRGAARATSIGFARGISTNAGGAWHQLTLPSNVPNRYISGLAIDPADTTGRTVYVGFNGFSRVWIEGPGAGLGHLWKTTDAGATWTDVSGNLPDIPVNDVLLVERTHLSGDRSRRRDLRRWRRDLVAPRRRTCRTRRRWTFTAVRMHASTPRRTDAGSGRLRR